jgi:hypothetical protein
VKQAVHLMCSSAAFAMHNCDYHQHAPTTTDGLLQRWSCHQLKCTGCNPAIDAFEPAATALLSQGSSSWLMQSICDMAGHHA